MGDEAFRTLSMVDPKGNDLLNKVCVAPAFYFLHLLCNVYQIFTLPMFFMLSNLFFQAMAEDKSDEWFAKHNRQKAAA